MDYTYEPLEHDFDLIMKIAGFEELEIKNRPSRSESWEEPDALDQENYEDWQEGEKESIKELYQNNIDKLENENEYFYGCLLSIYTHNYYSRLESFRDKYKDTHEIDYIKEELEKGIFDFPYKQTYLFEHQIKQFNFSLRKRFEFLKSRAETINYQIIYIEPRYDFDGYPIPESFKIEPLTPKANFNIKPLKWEGSQTELIELTKALILTGKVKGLQKDIITTLTQFFQIEIKNPDKIIQDIKNRNRDSETLFLDQLKKALYDYIQEK